MRKVSGNMAMIAAVLAVMVAMPTFAGEVVHPHKIVRPTHFALTPPMSEFVAPEPAEGLANREIPNRPATELPTLPGATPPDQIMGEGFISPDSGVLAPAPIIGFDGNNSDDNQAVIGFRLAPPDTQGAVGMQYYVQWVNLTWSVYDKATGAEVMGPLPGNSLWAAGMPGTVCANTNDGDPITLYDHEAQRWFMSQFALPGPNYTCLAVSQTSDPLGPWYVWEYNYGALMNDYPKFGVWPDGYYMTVNEFGGAMSATTVFDRTAMLAGDPNPAAQYFNIEGVQPAFPQPTNWGGGPPPPAGSPNYNAAFYDDAWGNIADLFVICEFSVDWATPANSTFSCPDDADAIDLTAAGLSFDSDLCGYSRNCIPQPGGQAVDSLSDRLMYPMNYRNLMATLGYEVMTVTHSVDVGGDQAGVRWYEFRNTGSGWFVADGGTFAPDGDSRWMGSSAVDQNGNIGLVYSISSATTNPSVGYTARLAGDPPGTMQTEQLLVAGGGSQGSVNRWGDYAAMHVDPDGCTFWGTAEYVNAGGAWIWDTYIGAFAMPGCTPSGFGTLDGMVYNAITMDPIEGAQVMANGYTAYTQADGTYAMNLPVDTYDINVMAFGFEAGFAGAIDVVEGMTTTQDFGLNPVGSAILDGYVTDGADHGWPLYAVIEIETGGMPVGTLYTDPFTGYYSVELPQGTPYDLMVMAMYPGYEPDGRGIVLGPVGQTESFQLMPDSSCAAPGYEMAMPDAPGGPSIPAVGPVNAPGRSSAGRVPGGLLAREASPVDPSMVLQSEEAYGVVLYPTNELVHFPDITAPGAWNVVAGGTASFYAGDFLLGDFSQLYIIDDVNNFFTLDTATGMQTAIGTSTPVGAESWTGMTGAADGTLYASSAACGVSSTLYTIDPGSGAASPIGPITGATCIIDIAINPAGEMYGVDIVTDTLFMIDPSTGTAGPIGSTGIDANYAQGMDFDDVSGTLYWASFNNGAFLGEMRVLDTTTGASSLVGVFPGGTTEVDSFGIAAFAGGECAPIPGALVMGSVSDDNTGEGLVGADVWNDVGGATTTVSTWFDPGFPEGAYYLFTPLVLAPSTRTFWAAYEGYAEAMVEVTLVPETVNQLDFALGAGWLELVPYHMDSRLNMGETEMQLMEVINYGGLEADISLLTFEHAGWAPAGPMDEIVLPDVPPERFNDRTSEAMPPMDAPEAAPLAAGDIISSWPTGLTFGWGLGVNKFADNLWIGNLGAAGGDDLDYEFDRAGAQTGKTIDTAPWMGVFAADMAFDSTTGMIWQMDVGGADCIHELDPISATTTGATICWGAATSERGVAYDPVSDTFWVGGWNTNAITRFDRSGMVLEVANVGLGIAGLAYNPTTEHLFVMVNADPNPIYVLDPNDSYNVIGTFSIPGFTAFGGAGFGFSCDGHLWAVDQQTQTTYEVDSGESGACLGGGGLPWLMLSPDAGLVPPAAGEPGVLPINAEFIADGADHFGLHQADIMVLHNTPYDVNGATVCFTKAFDDVSPTFWADDYIHSLAGARITQGCGGADFCPTAPMIRNVMARWLSNGYHGPDVPPMACNEATFEDVLCETTPNSDYIEQIFADGITTGCSTDPPLFCPDADVNRAQMATFITRLAYGPEFVPPPATGMMYPDVAPGMPGWWAAPYIEWLTNEGIVAGFPDGYYRPMDPTSNAQMAKMIVISINLPMCEMAD